MAGTKKQQKGKSQVDVNVDTLLILDYGYIVDQIFVRIKLHRDIDPADTAAIYELMGYYPAIYHWLSGMYVYMIDVARKDARDTYKKSLRDMLEQALRSCKFQYDALSRKVTVLRGEHDTTT